MLHPWGFIRTEKNEHKTTMHNKIIAAVGKEHI